MATQITQIDQPEQNRTVLRIEGDMLSDDAQLIEKIVNCTSTETGHNITVDLADLSFMDSEAASVLKRLKDLKLVDIEGVEIFLQSAVNMAERS